METTKQILMGVTIADIIEKEPRMACIEFCEEHLNSLAIRDNVEPLDLAFELIRGQVDMTDENKDNLVLKIKIGNTEYLKPYN